MSAVRLRPRSTHGLDSGPEALDWRRFGYCAERDVDPDLWFSVKEGDRGRAAHLCRRHCSVLAKCRADALRRPPGGGVFGGIVFADNRRDTRPAQNQPTNYRCGPWCGRSS